MAAAPVVLGPAWDRLLDASRSALPGLGTMRDAAWTLFAAHGVPTRRSEDYKYVDLVDVRDTAWQPALPLLEGPAPGAHVTIGACGAVACGSLPAGLTVTALADALGDPHVAALLERFAPTIDAIDALQRALLCGGVWIDVSPGAEIDQTVVIEHVTPNDDVPTATATLVVVTVGRLAQVRIVERWASAHPRLLVLDSTLVDVASGAQLDLVQLQSGAATSTWLQRTQVAVGRDAQARHWVCPSAAKLARQSLGVALDAPGAEATLTALYIPNAGGTVDHHTTIDHRAPNCRSSQLYQGILGRDARGVFNGRIVVRPGAQQVNADQLNRNLLLAPDARIDSKPQLEIFADDVKCSHGATVGQLDREAAFYLQSRGVHPATARRMLIEGFAQDLLARLTTDELQRLAGEHVSVALAQEV